jgi:lipopolysaccharide/colanic/teichoic acid biosynthesis glycosyltransferase
MKRLFDIVVSTVMLVVLSPVIAAIAVAVLLDLGAPVLFRQVRPGLKGRPFTLYKFRTMRGAHSGEPGSEGDEQRLTAFGRRLRASSLDELPELWNVLRGDMSLIGPRPLLMRYLPLYSPEQMRRHDVRPGLTGWAQVNGRNAISWEDKFRLDVWYVEHRSMMLDLKILLMTATAIFKRDGISYENSATMPEFRGSSRPAPSEKSQPDS